MTTTFPAPAPVSAAAPVPSTTRSTTFSTCPVERRALASAARDLAEALTGIAFDDRCCPARQKAILEFSAGVLRAVQGVATRSGEVTVHRACAAVNAATPVFAADVSAGAPAFAGGWIALAELLAGEVAPGHDHAAEGLLECEQRFRSVAGRTSFAVPLFLDACSPRERLLVVRTATRRVRLALRLREDRWTDLRAAVRGC